MKKNISTKIILSLLLVGVISVIVIQAFPFENAQEAFLNEFDLRREEVIKIAEDFATEKFSTLEYANLYANLSFNPVVDRSSFSDFGNSEIWNVSFKNIYGDVISSVYVDRITGEVVSPININPEVYFIEFNGITIKLEDGSYVLRDTMTNYTHVSVEDVNISLKEAAYIVLGAIYDKFGTNNIDNSRLSITLFGFNGSIESPHWSAHLFSDSESPHIFDIPMFSVRVDANSGEVIYIHEN